MIRHIARSLSGIALVALTFAISACESNPMGMDGQQGVPLTDLDLGGTPPDEIALLGPDTVRVVHGSALSVVVDADLDLRDHLRFVRKNGKLGIGRQNGFQEGVATITVTTQNCQAPVDTPPSVDPTFVGLDLLISGTANGTSVKANMTPVVIGTTTYKGSWDFAPLATTK